MRSRTGEDENKGIARNAFTRAEILKIQKQWEDSEHEAMRNDEAYSWSESIPGVGVLGRVWTKYRERTQKEELKRQVEEQRYILQLEAQRLRNEEEIEELKRRKHGKKQIGVNFDDDDDEKGVLLDGAPKSYRESLQASNNNHQIATDINIQGPTPTATGIGMQVQFEIPSQHNSSSNPVHQSKISKNSSPQDEMISMIKIQKEPPSKYPFSPHILSIETLTKIACKALPPSLLFHRWTRLYSLARDGDSFDTMLRHVKKHDKTVLIVRSTRGDIFGGFADTTWEIQHHHKKGGGFYGGGQCVLFRVVKHDEDTNEEDVIAHKWTGMNRFCQICDADKKMLAMGGGGHDGAFGLCVEDDFSIGSTGRCETFGNESLLSSGGEDFDILDIEIWGFLSGYF